ncbi:MAG TPA: hypothetical protein VFC19_11320 [Candidatus Limnocylindrales bacterium]|nr:hypothetical protein [Candidatus Limnocylindrales bacterium]
MEGFAATSPGVTGRKLSRGNPEVVAYEQHIGQIEDRVLAAIQAKVPGVRVGQRLRVVYGGVALRLPGNQVSALLSVPGVAAVHKDNIDKPLTDSSPR